MSENAVELVQVGMRAAIRDVQEWVDANTPPAKFNLSERDLRAYLLAMLITAGGYDDLSDNSGQG
jgi:hypothetical protein